MNAISAAYRGQLQSNEKQISHTQSTELRAENVIKEFPIRKSLFKRREVKRVIDSASLTLTTREIVGIVGNSGGGKTTFAKVFAGLLEPSSGNVFLDGKPLYGSNGNGSQEARKAIRFIFQNVNAPLNPRMDIYAILEEPLQVHTSMARLERKLRIEHVANEVELPLNLLHKYPRALSGGEKRRVGIARALMRRPSFIIADEPTAGLDPNLRDGLLKLFCRLRDEEHIGILLVSHDLHAVATICNEVVVMAGGKMI